MRYAALLLSGCSLTMIAPQQPTNPAEEPECSNSIIPPVTDTTFTVLASLVALPTAILSLEKGCGSPSDSECGFIIPIALTSTGTAVAFGLAANRGYGVRSDCRRAQGEHDNYLAHTAPRAPSPERSSRYPVLLVAGLIVGTVIAVAAGTKASEGFHL